jgi:hypothetical protein
MFATVLHKPAASIFRMTSMLKIETAVFSEIMGEYLPDYTASHPGRQ